VSMGKSKEEVVDAGKEALHEAQSLYRKFVNSRGHKRPPPHELDPQAAAGAFVASVKGFITAARSPYVIDKFTKSGVPVLVTIALVYGAGRLLLIPIQLIAVVASVVPGVRREGAVEIGNVALTDALSTVSLLLMLLLRSFIHKPIFKCFIHTLRDINPTLAKQVETSPVLPGKPQRSSKGTPASKGQGQQQEQTKPLGYKVARLAALTLLSRFGRRVPVFSSFVAPMMLFSSSERLLGTEHALLLALVGLVPPVAPWALDFLHLWRARCAPSHFAARLDSLRCQITHMSLPQ